MQDIICNILKVKNRPAIGTEIIIKNFKLAGIAIGNGWVDPIK